MSQKTYELIQVPLMEATIQVRFPGDARVDAVRGDFQQAVVEEFPHLYVPELSPGESPALMPYRFQNQDGTRTVALAINSLAYLTQQYPGWEAFRAEFLNYWTELLSRVAPREIGRVGMRYINRFDGELMDELNLSEAPDYLAPLRYPNCRVHRSVTTYESGETGLLVKVHKLQDEDTLLLDYDAFTHNATVDTIEQSLELLHDRIEAEFLSVLDDNYVRTLSAPKAGG